MRVRLMDIAEIELDEAIQYYNYEGLFRYLRIRDRTEGGT